jgi:hypothetical protein
MQPIWVFIHVLTAVALFCGAVGRLATFQMARMAGDLPSVKALLKASDFFERRVTIPASMLVLVFGLVAAWRGGWPVLGFLQGGRTNWLLAALVLYLAPMPAIPLYLLPARRRREQATAAAQATGEITPALRAALEDRGVRAYRWLELGVLVVVLALMVMKPF